MVDKVLTYNRETEWAAAQAVVKPDQSQGPRGPLAAARSSARKAGGTLGTFPLTLAHSITISLTIFGVIIKESCVCMLSHFSRAWLFVTLWIVAQQAPLCPLDSPGKNAGVGCHAFPQGIFPDPGIEPRSLPPPATAGRCFTLSPPQKPIKES